MRTPVDEHMGVRWGKDTGTPWRHNSHHRFLSIASRVCTIGSCFAVNFGRWIKLNGVEVFDPKWGLHYNPSTLRTELATCLQVSSDEVTWRLAQEDGPLFVDGLRHPVTESSYQELSARRAAIQREGRRALHEATVVVMTLGLSEVWEELIGDRTYVLNRTPPAQLIQTNRFRHRNLRVDECRTLILECISLVRSVNPTCTIVFTVSPVPLKTSFKDMDIRVSNHLSKSTLYVALQEVMEERPEGVVYFPAYDMFLAREAGEQMFQPDGRHPTASAVESVCRKFVELFALDPTQFAAPVPFWVPDAINGGQYAR